jgi:hypothetical protein
MTSLSNELLVRFSNLKSRFLNCPSDGNSNSGNGACVEIVPLLFTLYEVYFDRVHGLQRAETFGVPPDLSNLGISSGVASLGPHG